jgi:hypothetical protein
VVETRVEVGADLVDDTERERNLRLRDDTNRGGEQFHAPVRLLGTSDDALDLDDRFAGELPEQRKPGGVGNPFLQSDLRRAGAVADEGERDAAEGTIVFEVSRDPDGLAVQGGEFTREPSGGRQGSEPPSVRWRPG